MRSFVLRAANKYIFYQNSWILMNTNRWWWDRSTLFTALPRCRSITEPSSAHMSHSVWTRASCRYRRSASAGSVRSLGGRPDPADHAQEEAAQTGMSQWVALPKEALPDPAPYTWHITASPPHRRLRLKTQAGSCWLKIHLSVYYDLCMFHWARNEKERRGEQLH